MSDKATRRRGAVLERAILDAAWAELSDHGWEDFSVEAVAARAGTAKSVLYRRWPNRVHLAQAMLQGATRTAEPVRSEGDLRTDLLTFLTGMAAFLSGPFGPAVRSAVVDGDAALQTSIFDAIPGALPVGRLVAAAVERGELGEMPPPLAVNVGHALLMSDFLHTGTAPGSEALAAVVDTVWLPALQGSVQAARG